MAEQLPSDSPMHAQHSDMSREQPTSEQRALREDECAKCGSTMYWVDCWNGCDEGWHTDLHEEDPLWYDEGDMERCDICQGKAGWLVCGTCHPEAFDD